MCLSEALQPRAYMQFKRVVGPARGTLIVKDNLVARKANSTWCVVLGIPKGYSATGVAHHSRFGGNPAHMVI